MKTVLAILFCLLVNTPATARKFSLSDLTFPYWALCDHKVSLCIIVDLRRYNPQHFISGFKDLAFVLSKAMAPERSIFDVESHSKMCAEYTKLGYTITTTDGQWDRRMSILETRVNGGAVSLE